ncbi:hypothetical protein P8452_75381 [Trifolium repens]|nr:hypothetical protein P8452_75381 [Trifolium repens]
MCSPVQLWCWLSWFFGVYSDAGNVSAITQLFDLIPQGWLNMLRPLESLFPIIEHSNLTISQQLYGFGSMRESRLASTSSS